MPYASDAQRRYMHATHPKLAKEFDAATPKGADLPEKIGKQSADSTRNQTIRYKAMQRIAGGK